MEQKTNDEDNPDRQYSVARVAVWALGIIALIAVTGLIIVSVAGQEEGQASAGLRSVAQTAIGSLAAVAAARAAR